MKNLSKPFVALLILVVSLCGTVACSASESVVAQSSSDASETSKTAEALSISTTALPAGINKKAYLAVVEATGGTPGYTWSINSGNLPVGMALIPTTGHITGVPKQSGTSTFTLTVSDKGKPMQTVIKTFSITTLVPLAITTSALSSAVSESAYTTTLQASGGEAPYTWSIASGSLPFGMTLDSSSGRIAGTPKVSGVSTFSAAVVHHGTLVQNTSKTFSISTLARLAITSSILSSAVTGSAYAASMQAVGGVPPYSWSISSGSLPAGLTLDPNSGSITGKATASGTSTFTETVTDHGAPLQSVSQASSLTTIAQLSVPSVALPVGSTGTAYAAKMQVSGGVPAYTWSITSGSLPNGLSMAGTTGIISGTPTVAGTFNFVAKVIDNGSPTQSLNQRVSIKISVPATIATVAAGTTWYIRTDGGTRYSGNVPTGECDGKSDTAYSGIGYNQHCAYNDFRYMWDDRSGVVGSGAWVIAGGDTVVIRGCHALPDQQNAANPDCRIGWDGAWGAVSGNWCYGVGSYTCYNPPIPAGTPGNHTRILGACAYGTYSCTPINNSYPYGATNETQLYGGFSLTWTFNLAGTQNVDIEGIELTTHNGQCTRGGAPAYPRNCSNNQPLDDYAQNGFLTDNTTSNLLLQDVYIHGFNSAGLFGPIGGPITVTRVFSGFNGFAGWNFADVNDTPDAPGSSITASFVTMIGNGCYEQYPIVNGTFPAQACYDDLSQGFGDAWSGQDTLLDTLICDHCVQKYNTKDGFIGPHTQVKHLTITNSASIGNMGSQWKFGTDVNATVLFQNNLTEGNSYRMSAALPGAAHSFASSSGLSGSYLSDFGRAGGDMFSIITQAGSSLHFYGNSMVLASQTGLDINCGVVNKQGNTAGAGTCTAVPILSTNNLFVGYTDPNCGSCGGLAPGLYYKADSSINITSSYNLEYGIRNGDPCGTNNNLCADPWLRNEPGPTWPGSESALDVYDPMNPTNSFHPAPASPMIGAGKVITGLTADYYGVAQPATPTIGAVAN